MEENFLNTKMIPILFSLRYFVIYINRFHYNVSLTLNAKLRQLVLITESGPEASLLSIIATVRGGILILSVCFI